ncbi:MAG: hypothetical protein U0235_32015 [Polyangiaceae bacterium]
MVPARRTIASSFVGSAAAFACVLGLVAACGSSKRSGLDTTGKLADGGDPTTGDFSDKDAAGPATPPVVAHLHGKVVAPEGTVPIANAIVYLTSRLPDAIPSHVYCDTCIHLTPAEPYAYSAPDGTFDLPAYATGTQYLVVQKGQFRRVRQVDVRAGDQPVAGPYTRLPGKNDPANNDTIPKIAMAVGGYDRIDFSLKKLGIEEFARYGDGPFDLGGPPPGQKTGKNIRDLTAQVPELAGYHIVLLPCATFGFSRSDTSGSNVCGAPMASEETALRQYVDGGGKLYVTDYSYEAIRQTWPGFVSFYDDKMQVLSQQSAGIGSACRAGAEDTPGTPTDPGLAGWLNAIGDTSVTLQQSWTRIASVAPQPGVDPEGKPVTITPKVWMTSDYEGSAHPATVSFEQKCGRVLFSTYHAEGGEGATLLAQEKALLFILLEVGVCVGQLPPPPIR